MTWTAVARKDFQDARLSKTLWVLTGLFVLMAAGMAYLYATVPDLRVDVGGVSTLGLLFLPSAPVTLFIAIGALVVAAGSIAGERSTGSAKLLLGLPHTRGDVVVGKLVGRATVVVVAIVVGLLVMLGVVLALYPSFSLVDYALFVALTLLLAVAYVGIMVGISALTASGGRAMAFGVGAFLVLEIFADIVPLAALFVVNGFSLQGVTTTPGWAAFLSLASPTSAYQNALSWFLGGGVYAGANLDAPLSAVPFYLTGWASLAVLALWLVVPLAVGYRRFRAADL